MMHPTSPTNPKGYAVEPFCLEPEERGNPLEAVMHENGPEYAAASFSQTLARLLQNFSGSKIDRPVIEEILDDMADHGELARTQTKPKSAATGGLPELMMILEYIKAHPHPTAIYAVFYIFNTYELDAINSHLTPAQFGKVLFPNGKNKGKSAVNKAIDEAQEHFRKAMNLREWPKRPEQRTKEAKAKMAAKRIANLKK